MPSIPLYQVDAFVTARQFSGNPAAVCLLPAAADPAWMQDVAMEMNLSETAFLVQRADGFDLRWFTPSVEVDLCGHATLASAHTLWESGQLPPSAQARFHTRSGLLTADRRGALIELNFPAKLAQRVEPPPELIAALGITPTYVGKNQFDYLIEVEHERTVREMKPDFTSLRKVGVRGVIVTSRSTEFDFISRFFAPGSGIDEDPVTGSAHTALGPYWMAKLHKDVFRAFQASRRGGLLEVSVRGDRVLLAGTARTTLRGELV